MKKLRSVETSLKTTENKTKNAFTEAGLTPVTLGGVADQAAPAELPAFVNAQRNGERNSGGCDNLAKGFTIKFEYYNYCMY